MANKFFLDRRQDLHYGDRIEFMTHLERSLTIPDAIELCAYLAFLIDDDKAIGKQIQDLRGNPPAAVPVAVPAPVAPKTGKIALTAEQKSEEAERTAIAVADAIDREDEKE